MIVKIFNYIRNKLKKDKYKLVTLSDFPYIMGRNDIKKIECDALVLDELSVTVTDLTWNCPYSQENYGTNMSCILSFNQEFIDKMSRCMKSVRNLNEPMTYKSDLSIMLNSKIVGSLYACFSIQEMKDLLGDNPRYCFSADYLTII